MANCPALQSMFFSHCKADILDVRPIAAFHIKTSVGFPMQEKRRTLITALAVAPLIACQSVSPLPVKQKPMYGLIGKIKTHPGQRDSLASILLGGTQDMPGCLSYIVATDPTDPDALWITEVWDSPASHKASLGLPSVKAALSAGRPLVSGFGERFETNPVGGFGLPPAVAGD